MGWLDGWSKKTLITIAGSADAALANDSEEIIAYYSCCPTDLDSCTQYLYRPATRYAGTHDRTYIIGNNAAGVVSLKYWDEDDLAYSASTTLHDFALQDDHAGGSVIVLQYQTGANVAANGTILTAYVGKYTQNVCYSKRSDNAEDSSSWGAEITVSDGTQILYPYLCETSDGTIWLFAQLGAGAAGTISYWNLTLDPAEPDNDAWGSPVTLCDDGGGGCPYFKPWVDGADIYGMIGILTAGDATIDAYRNVWYVKYHGAGGHWEDAAGTTKTLPLTWADAAHSPDVVFSTQDGTQHCTNIWDLKTDASHNPHLLFIDQVASESINTTGDIFRAVYDNGAWVSTDTGIDVVRFGLAGYFSGAEFEEGNPDIIYAAVPDGSSLSQIQGWEYIDTATPLLDTFEWGADTDHLHDAGGDIAWSGSATCTISTEKARTGTRSAKFSGHATTPAIASFPLTVASDYRLHIWGYKETLQQYMYPIRHGNGTHAIDVRIDASENLLYRDASGDWTDTTKNITADKWFHLEVRNINWTAGTYDLYLDGVIAATGAEMYDTASYANIWQIESDDANAGQDFYIDNIQVAGIWYIADGNNGTTAIQTDGKITQACSGDNFRPITVLNGAGRFKILWFYSELYTSVTSWTSSRFAYPGFNTSNMIGFNKEVRTDFGDISFTQVDGTTLQPAGSSGKPWIQDKTDSWLARLWVKVGTVPISPGSLTIYCYSGHADDTNANDKTVMQANFDQADDHAANPDTVNDWTMTNTITASGGDLLLTSVATNRGLIEYKLHTHGMVECRGRFKTNPDHDNGVAGTISLLGAGETGSVSNDTFRLVNSNSIDTVQIFCNEGGSFAYVAMASMDIGNYHTWAIRWYSSTSVKAYREEGIGIPGNTLGLVYKNQQTSDSYVPDDSGAVGWTLVNREGSTAGDFGYVSWQFLRPILVNMPVMTISNAVVVGGTKNGVDLGTVSKLNGVAIANIAKINGMEI